LERAVEQVVSGAEILKALPASKLATYQQNDYSGIRARLRRALEELRKSAVKLDVLIDEKSRRRNLSTLEAARSRGQLLQEGLIDKGLVVTASVLAEALGVTPQAVNKGVQDGRYFALSGFKRGLFYPAFLADPELRDRGLLKLVRALGDEDPWSKWHFLTSLSGFLGGVTPLDAVRAGLLAEALTAAGGYLER
jgi:hypothetical protein